MESPKITEVLGQHGIDIARCRFTVPDIGKGLSYLFHENKGSMPKAQQLAIRQVTLRKSEIIPFSFYGICEKYLSVRMGEMQLFIVEPCGTLAYFHLKCGANEMNSSEFVIPPLHWHAVRAVTDTSYRSVISSQHNPDDILWEHGVKKLLQNQHLNGNGHPHP